MNLKKNSLLLHFENIFQIKHFTKIPDVFDTISFVMCAVLSHRIKYIP